MAGMMDDILAPLKERKQMRFIVLTMVVYAGLLIPFKPFAIIPGFTELRPANFVPVLFGVLFGPAAAWGSAVGNLLADVASYLELGAAGTLSAGSVFGFIGNFLFAYVAWRVWMLFARKDMRIDPGRIGVFALASLIASLVCAFVIGLGVFALGAKNLGDSVFMVMIVTLNNLGPALVLGSIGLWLFYGKAKEAGWLLDRRAD